MDVLTTAYRATQGAPACSHADRTEPQWCARCGQRTSSWDRTTTVVSKLFTAFDAWADPTSRYLCSVCAWGYRHAPLRNGPHLVTPASLTALDRPQLAARLGHGAVAPDHALIVPLRPGRKHLLPDAAWGQITTEHGHLTWTAADASRLEVLTRLRGFGFGSRMLAQHAPAYPVLARLPRHMIAGVLDDWRHLSPWRSRPPWLALATYATTPEATP